MWVHVHVFGHVCGGLKATSGIFLETLRFETEFLSESRVLWVNELQEPARLHSQFCMLLCLAIISMLGSKYIPSTTQRALCQMNHFPGIFFSS